VYCIGVENVRGSGMLTGQTSRAYDEALTLPYATARSASALTRSGPPSVPPR
ncbi:unnamed protein product, partial [Laminaria digitata]